MFFTVFKSTANSKFSREYKCLTLIIVNNKHFWPRQRESISAKTSVRLKTWTFSPANLSPSMVIPTSDSVLAHYFILAKVGVTSCKYARKCFIYLYMHFATYAWANSTQCWLVDDSHFPLATYFLPFYRNSYFLF